MQDREPRELEHDTFNNDDTATDREPDDMMHTEGNAAEKEFTAADKQRIECRESETRGMTPHQSIVTLLALATACHQTAPRPSLDNSITRADAPRVHNEFCRWPLCTGVVEMTDCAGSVNDSEAVAALEDLRTHWNTAESRPFALRSREQMPSFRIDKRKSEDDFLDPFPPTATNDVIIQTAPDYSSMVVLVGKDVESYIVCRRTMSKNELDVLWLTRPVRS